MTARLLPNLFQPQGLRLKAYPELIWAFFLAGVMLGSAIIGCAPRRGSQQWQAKEKKPESAGPLQAPELGVVAWAKQLEPLRFDARVFIVVSCVSVCLLGGMT